MEVITTLNVIEVEWRAAVGSQQENADVAAEARPAGVGSSARRRSWLVRGQDRGSRRKRGVKRRGTRGSTRRPEDVIMRCNVGSVERLDVCRLSTKQSCMYVRTISNQTFASHVFSIQLNNDTNFGSILLQLTNPRGE